MSTGLDAIPCSLLTLAVGLSVMLVVIIVLRKRGRPIDNPACGKCGYSVQGLPTFTCPECGSDLRNVGIVTPGGSGISPKMHGTIWCSSGRWSCPFRPRYSPWSSLWQPRRQPKHTRDQRFHAPASGAYQRIDLDQRLTEKGNRVVSNRLDLHARPLSGQTHTDPNRTGRPGIPVSRSVRQEAKANGGLDENKVLTWMSQAGIDTKNKQIGLEAAELMTLAQRASFKTADELPARHFRPAGASRYSRVGPAKWVPVVACAVLAGGLAAGVPGNVEDGHPETRVKHSVLWPETEQVR